MELHEKGSIEDLANYRIEIAKSDLDFSQEFWKKNRTGGRNPSCQ